MDTNEPTDLACPSGPSSCPIFAEVLALRQTVADLRLEAHTDSLTGLYNNRHFQLALRQEIERTQRTGQPTTMILVDLDHFKHINDSRGHVAGDEVLRKIANLFLSSLRKLDIPCRYGGEEFAILLPSTPLLVAIQVAERLRVAIEHCEINHDGASIPVTASMGVDTFTTHHNLPPQAFVERVDQWLYQAKESGRNCIRHGTAKPENTPENPSFVSSSEKDALNQL